MPYRPKHIAFPLSARLLGFVIAVCLTCGATTAGTPKGRILGSLTNDKDTIDFGYLMAGNDSAFVYRDVFFVNDGDEDLVVRDSGVEIRVLAPTNSLSEFSYPAVFPLNVPVGRDTLNPVRLSLRCQASTFLLDAPEGENAVRLRVRLAFARTGKSDSTVSERVFVLRFVKTVRPLWVTPLIRFDSLYAGSSTFSQATVVLRNTDIRRTLLVDDTLSTVVSGSSGRFAFEQSPLISFSRDTAKPRTVGVRYTAGLRGTDSVRFGIVHFNPSVLKLGSDTTFMVMCGTSVEQELRLAGVRGRRAVLRGDTVDVGSWTVGAKDSVAIVVENRGNIPFFSRSELRSIDAGNETPFSILDTLHKGKRHIAVRQTDSMRVVFAPASVGTFVMKVILTSDIGTRIKGVPDSVGTIVFYLRGQGRERAVTSSVVDVNFDSVVVNDECPTTRTINLRLRNSSTSQTEIMGVRALPGLGYGVPSGTISIPAQSEAVVPIVFAPSVVGSYAAVLIIQSAIDDGPLLLQLSGVGVRPVTMELQIPSSQNVFPGHEIIVPVWGRADIMNKASRCSAVLDYDTTVLSFIDYDNIDCAAASGNVQIGRTQGGLRLQIVMAASFFTKDTLIKLRFRSMLGQRDRSALSVQTAQFGTESCAKIFSTVSPTGVVVLDSLCGLKDKLPRGPVAAFALRPPFPHPLTESATVRYRIPTAGDVRVGIYNLMGECVQTLASGYHGVGNYETSFPVTLLENGVYVMRLQSGMFSEDVTIVVSH